MKRAEKAATIETLREKFRQAKAVVLADYRGLSVERMSALRGRLREAQVEFRVVKNTLARRAAREAGLDGLEAYFEGPTAVALAHGDPVAPPKLLSEFGKEWESLRMKAGLLEGRLLGVEELQAVATLPGLDALRGKLIGLLQAPASRMVSVLAAPGAQVARVLAARATQGG